MRMNENKNPKKERERKRRDKFTQNVNCYEQIGKHHAEANGK